MTLQEYLNDEYPTSADKERVKKINIRDINYKEGQDSYYKFLDGGELDLRDFKNVEKINIEGRLLLTPLIKVNVSGLGKLTSLEFSDCELTDLDLSGLVNLTDLNVSENNLTSINFLNTLPNPEKLEYLTIYNNKIRPTDINFFSKFINLNWLKVGTMERELNERGKHNKFFGSLKAYQNITKLRGICIEATDINEGLEYLPFSLAKATAEELRRKPESYEDNKIGGYAKIECSPHNTEAKCREIQNQLRPFNYDLEAWQLAHPHLIYQAHPHLFQQEETREKWLEAVNKKIEKTQEKLTSEIGAKKIKRLKSKIRELGLIKTLMNEREIFEDSLKAGVRWYDKQKEDKATQTEIITIQEIKK